MKTLDEEWNEFEAAIFAGDHTVSSVQIMEMKKAFFGGAAVALRGVTEQDSVKDLFSFVGDRNSEIKEFVRDMMARHVGGN